MDRCGKRIVRAGVVAIAAFSLTFAETNFSRLNGFEPRFLPPAHTSYKNIKTDYNAKGDGVTDDTKAFQDAIMSGTRTIYVPAGTYLLKDQIRVRDGITRFLLIGECRTTTVLKLADNSPGFNNPAIPKAFVHTRANTQFGEQNFTNYVYHLTLEIGKGNSGAVGLNHHTSNTGQVRDVCVRATDPVNGKGLRGIAFDDWWYGPGGGRYLEVDGFKSGIYVGSAQNHVTLEHVNIRNCDIGLHNEYFPDTVMTVSCRKLVTTSCATAVKNGGQLALIESNLGGSGAAAIDNRGSLLCRAVTTSGFTKAIASTTPSGDLAGPNIDNYLSHAVQYLWQPAAGFDKTLGLPVKESPEIQYPSSASGWTFINTTSSGDMTPLVQQAIDAGATDILLATGRIQGTITLRNAVRRIMGLGVRWITMSLPGSPVFRVADGTAPAVFIELVYDEYGSSHGTYVEHTSKRPVVWRNSIGGGGYRNTAAAEGGEVYIECVGGGPFTFKNIKAWVKDLNTEGNRIGVYNDNATLWLFGHKTEAYSTKIQMTNGGFTELLGGVYRQTYPLTEQQSKGVTPDNAPLFVITNSHATLHFRNSDCFGGTGGEFWYKYSVRETRGTETRNQLRDPALCGAVTMYAAYSAAPPTAARRGLVHPAVFAGNPEASAMYSLQGRRIGSARMTAKGVALVVQNGRMRMLCRGTPGGVIR